MLSFDPDKSAAVLIGTSRYLRDPENFPELPSVGESIEQLVGLLQDKSIVGIERICTLVDKGKPGDVLEALVEVAESTEDLLLVYYAGHGVIGDADSPLYLALRDTTSKNAYINGIASTQLKKIIDASFAKKKVLIVDSCYSARMIGGMDDPLSSYRSFMQIRGTFAIASAPANSKARAAQNESLTAFTGALVDVLRDGIECDKQSLSLVEIYEAVRDKLRERGDAPDPVKHLIGDADKFMFAKNAGYLHTALLGKTAPRATVDICHRTIVYLGLTVSTTAEPGTEKHSALLADCHRILEGKTTSHDGTVVRASGELHMSAFESADDAVQAAFAVQESFLHAHRIAGLKDVSSISPKMGLYTGDVGLKNGEYDGFPVQAAVALAKHAKDRQILTTRETLNELPWHPTERLIDRVPVDDRRMVEAVELVWGDMTRVPDEEPIQIPDSRDRALHLEYRGRGLTLEHSSQPITLGRDKSADIRVEDGSVSRMHARIEPRDGKFRLVDDSLNGTDVIMSEGKHLVCRREIVLTGRGEIKLGAYPNEFTIEFWCEPEAAGPPPQKTPHR